ncbi:hypothetical protein H1D41_12895, partial [Rhodobacteraceae bacterium MYP1-1]|nr:hypothetical protein [Paenihalocynthiibacter styelae]
AAGKIDTLSAAFHSDLDSMIEQHRPDVWFFAHSHRRICAKVHGAEIRNISVGYRELIGVIETGELLDSDLLQAVGFVAPNLRISPRLMAEKKEFPATEAVRISDLCYARLTVDDTYQTRELSDKLIKFPEAAHRVVEIATDQLRQAIYVQVELGQITNTFDLNDTSVPAIEDHEQNEHRDGILHLVRLIIDCFHAAADLCQECSLSIARSWLQLPGNIGLRLYLHVARAMELIDPNEAIETMLHAKSEQLWSSRREVALFIKDQSAKADRDLVEQLEARFLNEAPARFHDADTSSTSADWRPLARDRDLWIYLYAPGSMFLFTRRCQATLMSESDLTWRGMQASLSEKIRSMQRSDLIALMCQPSLSSHS